MELPARLANRTAGPKLAEAVTAGLGSAAPPYISIEGGSFTLVDSSGSEVPVDTKHLDCIIVSVNMAVAVQRVFWGERLADGRVQPIQTYQGRSGTYRPPLCFSDNGVGASSQAADPQSASCQTCHWSGFNQPSKTDATKMASACRKIKKIAVMVPGYDFPFLLRVPVMSHENLRVYGDKFKGQKFDVPDVVTRVTFVHGAVGQLDFAAVGFTDDPTDATVQLWRKEKRADGLLGVGDVPIQGQLAAPGASAATDYAAKQALLAAQGQQEPQLQLSQQAPPPAKRGRKPAQPAAQQPLPADDSIPPFLRRAAPAAGSAAMPASPFEQATPSAAAQGGPQANSGIVANPPPPNEELSRALASVFDLKT
jgi:hypothetical protein